MRTEQETNWDGRKPRWGKRRNKKKSGMSEKQKKKEE